mmetsp:Transcript_2540/g.5986  ORF Transcript_2540/g.5986 Transcript_2540/m.5986 type:complete len:588 (+) Transcript_2540:207-1970(+)
MADLFPEDSPFDTGDDAGTEIPLETEAAEADSATAQLQTTTLEDDDPFQANHSSVDAVASYDELLAPPSYSDSVAFADTVPSSENKEAVDPLTSSTSSGALGVSANSVEPSTSDVVQDENITFPSKAKITITVTDPVKQPEKDSLIGGTYINYKVEARTELPHFKKNELVVRRRFREFVALAERLDRSHRGYFIPPRPDKNMVEGKLHGSEFVEVRRVALQRYLQKLASHPVLCESRELQLFLEWEGNISTCGEWKEMENQGWKVGLSNLPKQILGSEKSIPSMEEAQSKGDGRNLIRGFKELKQKLKNKAGMGEQVQIQDDGQNEELVEEKAKLKEVEKHLAEASAQAESMIRRMERVADSFGDFGLSAIKTSKFEEEEGLRNGKYSESGEPIRDVAAQMKVTGTLCVRKSRLVRSATENTAAQLSYIHNYLGMMPAVYGAFRARKEAILTYQTMTNELMNKRRMVMQLEEQGKNKFGGDKGKTRKVYELKQDIEALEKGSEAARKEFERIAERNKEELARFYAQKERDLAIMLTGYAKVQAALAERAAVVWEDIQDAMNDEQQDNGASSSSPEEEITTVNPVAAK